MTENPNGGIGTPPKYPATPIIEVDPSHANIAIVPSGQYFIEDDRRVDKPAGFDYDGTPVDKDGVRREHANSHFGSDPGLRINLAHTAGSFGFPYRKKIVFLPGVDYGAFMDFETDLKPRPGFNDDDQGMWWQLWVDGDMATAVVVNNLITRAEFSFKGTGQPMQLEFRLQVNRAVWDDNSVITWLRVGWFPADQKKATG